ncbi:levanase [Neocallimastix sp. 'constans']
MKNWCTKLFMVATLMSTSLGRRCIVKNDQNNKENPSIDDHPSNELFNEQFRPQIHFTPSKNWMNDPNGMVYVDGTYHLFFQYNPEANVWGNMSWGHATSTDLMHWTEHPVAITRDELGDVFSGSAVIDKYNTAGYGNDTMIAIFTSAGSAQQQSIAYSIDDGLTFTRYENNPIIKNDNDLQRDPKVFWHEESKQWIMCLAQGWKMGIEIWGSTDLKNWNKLSEFKHDLPDRPKIQWECPDLISFEYNGKKKWVLLVSVNPGGYIVGSGTMYFIGDFDGKRFTADERNYPLWIDYGMDNYAGVTWGNTGDRRVFLGWMNNWEYADKVPNSPWRSAMTLPRELKLKELNGELILCSPVVKEIEGIAKKWNKFEGVNDSKFRIINSKTDKAYQVQLNIELNKDSIITLSNSKDEKLIIEIDAANRKLTTHRDDKTGQSDFSDKYVIKSIDAPLNTESSTLKLDIYVDQSSVEILSDDGRMSMTNLVFPSSIYDSLSVSGAKYTIKIRPIKSIHA